MWYQMAYVNGLLYSCWNAARFIANAAPVWSFLDAGRSLLTEGGGQLEIHPPRPPLVKQWRVVNAFQQYNGLSKLNSTQA